MPAGGAAPAAPPVELQRYESADLGSSVLAMLTEPAQGAVVVPAALRWVVANAATEGEGRGKRLVLELGREVLLGRDCEGAAGAEHHAPGWESVGIKDLNVSRQQLSVKASASGVRCINVGRNPVRYIAPELVAGGAPGVKYAAKAAFSWAEGGAIELSYKFQGSSRLVLRREPLLLPHADSVSPGPDDLTPMTRSASAIWMVPTDGLSPQAAQQGGAGGASAAAFDSELELGSPRSPRGVPGAHKAAGAFTGGSAPAGAVDGVAAAAAAAAAAATVSTAASPASPAAAGAAVGSAATAGAAISAAAARVGAAEQQQGPGPVRPHKATFLWGSSSDDLGSTQDPVPLPPSRSNSPVYDPNHGGNTPVRTTDGFPFKKAGSPSGAGGATSIFSSDKHHLDHKHHLAMLHAGVLPGSPRKRPRSGTEDSAASVAEDGAEGLKRSSSSEGPPVSSDAGFAASGADAQLGRAALEPRDESDRGGAALQSGISCSSSPFSRKDKAASAAAAAGGSAVGAAAPAAPAPPTRGTGARVGSEYQVELPSVLIQPRPINEVLGEGKGSIGAWTKAFHAEPEPLAANAEAREDTTLQWKEDERQAFHRAMFEHMKDFPQMWRAVPMFQQRGKRPNDLISYYYKRYKSSEEYRQWKQFVQDGTGQLPEGVVIEDERAAAKLDATSSNGPIGLRELIDMGWLVPGPAVLDVLSTSQAHVLSPALAPDTGSASAGAGADTAAELRPDGVIRWGGRDFDSPSDFCLAVKRESDPSLTSCDGWASVRYRGRPLSAMRAEASARKVAQQAQQGPGPVASAPTPTPAPQHLQGQMTTRGATRRASVSSTQGLTTRSAAAGALSSLPSAFLTSGGGGGGSRGMSTSVSALLGFTGSQSTTKDPWKASKPDQPRSIRLPGHRTMLKRAPGYFDLHVEPESEEGRERERAWAGNDDGEAESPFDVNHHHFGNGNNDEEEEGDPSGKAPVQRDIRVLMNAGLVVPGRKALRVYYKGHLFEGDLSEMGVITDCGSGVQHDKPSHWSLECKRSLHATLRTDSGWDSVRVVPVAQRRLAASAAADGGDSGGGSTSATITRTITSISSISSSSSSNNNNNSSEAPNSAAEDGLWSLNEYRRMLEAQQAGAVMDARESLRVADNASTSVQISRLKVTAAPTVAPAASTAAVPDESAQDEAKGSFSLQQHRSFFSSLTQARLRVVSVCGDINGNWSHDDGSRPYSKRMRAGAQQAVTLVAANSSTKVTGAPGGRESATPPSASSSSSIAGDAGATVKAAATAVAASRSASSTPVLKDEVSVASCTAEPSASPSAADSGEGPGEGAGANADDDDGASDDASASTDGAVVLSRRPKKRIKRLGLNRPRRVSAVPAIAAAAGPGSLRRGSESGLQRHSPHIVREDDRRFCVCQVRRGGIYPGWVDPEAVPRHGAEEDFFLQCGKATGACRGWVHPRCFGLQISRKDADQHRDFVCPLCSADGVDLVAFDNDRQARDVLVTYEPGTVVMTRIDFPAEYPVGWFPGKIVEVDTVHHASRPYRIAYAFDPSLTEWISLGPNDPTRMLAKDWSRSSCYAEQDAYWRKRSAKAVTKSRESA